MIKLIKKYLIEKTEDKKITLFRYLFFGGFVTVINIILLYLFVELFSLNYSVANIISMIICITITYILSKKFIFTQNVSICVKKEFISYVIIAIISIFVDTLVLYCGSAPVLSACYSRNIVPPALHYGVRPARSADCYGSTKPPDFCSGSHPVPSAYFLSSIVSLIQPDIQYPEDFRSPLN